MTAKTRKAGKADRSYFAGLRRSVRVVADTHPAGVGPEELRLLARYTARAQRDLKAMAKRLDATNRRLAALFARLDRLEKQRASRGANVSGKKRDAFQAMPDRQRGDFHETAEKRYARIARTGETIPWPEMRGCLRSRVAGKNPRRPRVRSAKKLPLLAAFRHSIGALGTPAARLLREEREEKRIGNMTPTIKKGLAGRSTGSAREVPEKRATGRHRRTRRRTVH